MVFDSDLLNGLLTFINYYVILELWSCPIIYVFFLKDFFAFLWNSHRQLDEDEEYYENFSFLLSNNENENDLGPSTFVTRSNRNLGVDVINEVSEEN